MESYSGKADSFYLKRTKIVYAVTRHKGCNGVEHCTETKLFNLTPETEGYKNGIMGTAGGVAECFGAS